MSTAHAIIHAQTALMPLVYSAVSVEFALTTAQIGLIIAITDLVGGLSQIGYGYITRFVGRATVLAGGYMLLGISLFFAGLARTAGQLLVALIGARLGGSPQHPLGSAVISDHFEGHRRGLAISTHIAGANVGAVIMPFAGTLMIATVGWNLTLALLGIPALIMGALVWRLMRDDGTRGRSGEFTRPVARGVGIPRRDLVTIIATGTVAAGGRGLLVAPFVLLYLSGPLGFDETTVAALYTALLLGAVIGPIVAGYLSDRLGRLLVLVGCYVVSGLGIVAFVAAGSNLLLLGLLFLPFGMAIFAESPILQALLADRTPPSERASAYSIYFTITFGVGALWALVLGIVIDRFGFQTGFLIMAISYFAAALIISTLPRRPMQPRAEPVAATS
jgi:MFS family permease